MALTIKYGGEQEGDWIIVDARLCLTEEDTLVPEGDPAGRWLFTIPGRRVSMADAVKYGLVAEAEPEPEVELEAEVKPVAKKAVVSRKRPVKKTAKK